MSQYDFVSNAKQHYASSASTKKKEGKNCPGITNKSRDSVNMK